MAHHAPPIEVCHGDACTTVDALVLHHYDMRSGTSRRRFALGGDKVRTSLFDDVWSVSLFLGATSGQRIGFMLMASRCWLLASGLWLVASGNWLLVTWFTVCAVYRPADRLLTRVLLAITADKACKILPRRMNWFLKNVA